MVELAVAKANRDNLPVEGLVADMRSFAVKRPVDLALNLLTSISYLLDPEALLRHFESTYRALAPGGVYIVENNHPARFLER
jgi:hypothetical protein